MFEIHSSLFSEVLDRPQDISGWKVPTTSVCEPRLRAAVKTAERINEVSCGLWMVKAEGSTRWTKKSAAVLFEVDATPEFLKRVGIEVKGRTKAGATVTTVRVDLGCDECARMFVGYCHRRWKKDEDGIHNLPRLIDRYNALFPKDGK